MSYISVHMKVFIVLSYPWFYLILMTAQWEKYYCYYLHFTREKLIISRVSKLAFEPRSPGYNLVLHPLYTFWMATSLICFSPASLLSMGTRVFQHAFCLCVPPSLALYLIYGAAVQSISQQGFTNAQNCDYTVNGSQRAIWASVISVNSD